MVELLLEEALTTMDYKNNINKNLYIALIS